MKSMDTGHLKIELVSVKIYNLKEKNQTVCWKLCVRSSDGLKKKKKNPWTGTAAQVEIPTCAQKGPTT